MWTETMIKSFLALSECKNITQAAEKLFFSQQALSKQISRLEGELGCQLVIRGRNGIKLTEEGEVYRDTFYQVMEEISQAASQISEMHKQNENRIRIAQLEMATLPDSLRPFYQKFSLLYPETEMDFVVYDDPELLEKLEDDSVDIAISFDKGFASPKWRSYEVLPLYSVDIAVCVNKNYPGASEWKSYKDIPDIPFIMNQNKKEEEIARVRGVGFSPERIIWEDNLRSTLMDLELLKGATLISSDTLISSNKELLLFSIRDGKYGQSTVCAIWKKTNPKVGMKKFTESLGKYVRNYVKKRKTEETA